MVPDWLVQTGSERGLVGVSAWVVKWITCGDREGGREVELLLSIPNWVSPRFSISSLEGSKKIKGTGQFLRHPIGGRCPHFPHYKIKG